MNLIHFVTTKSLDRLHKGNSYVFYHLHITESELSYRLPADSTISCFHPHSILCLTLFRLRKSYDQSGIRTTYLYDI